MELLLKQGTSFKLHYRSQSMLQNAKISDIITKVRIVVFLRSYIVMLNILQPLLFDFTINFEIQRDLQFFLCSFVSFVGFTLKGQLGKLPWRQLVVNTNIQTYFYVAPKIIPSFQISCNFAFGITTLILHFSILKKREKPNQV